MGGIIIGGTAVPGPGGVKTGGGPGIDVGTVDVVGVGVLGAAEETEKERYCTQ